MSCALLYCRWLSGHKWAQVWISVGATFAWYTWSLDFFFTINEIFKEFQGGVIVLDSTHSTSVASKIVNLCQTGSFISGCNMDLPTSELRLKIVFLGLVWGLGLRLRIANSSNIGPLGALPIKSTIFEASPRLLKRFSKFRPVPNRFVKTW